MLLQGCKNLTINNEMMRNSSYYRYTGESSNHFNGNNDSKGYFVLVAIFAALFIIALALISYFRRKSEHLQAPQQERTLLKSTPPSIIHEEAYPSPSSPIITTETPKTTEPEKQLEPAKTVQQVKISRYYEEGYDNGYDDGEDDAVSGNGYGGQFDDSCPYKGKKRKEYQLGYEEGYEAGYDDNNYEE